jgi:hypothetical protein
MANSMVRTALMAILGLAFVASLAQAAILHRSESPQLPQQRRSQSVIAAPRRVDVTLGVMSRCPDALFFEGIFDRVLQQVNSKITLTMAFIAQKDKDEQLGYACKHGPQECRGNVHQLCVIDALDPTKASKRFDIGFSEAQKLGWNFVQCENFVGGLKSIGEQKLAHQCVDALGKFPRWEEDGIEKCINGKRGKELLAKSAGIAKHKDIQTSATLLIDDKVSCIRDGGEWKSCSGGHEVGDFVKQINDAYARKNGLQDADERPTPTIVSRAHLTKRQANNSSSPPPANSNTNQPNNSSNNPNTQQGAPLSVFTFIIAIALFVLVVSFVLLRIFVRNRRLRRLGIYPETPLERLLGHMPREYEDTLQPPKLWEAKIADARANDNAMLEKPARTAATLAPTTSASRGWDTLMPLSAALPPSLYPVIYHHSNADSTNKNGESRQQTQANGMPALSSSAGGRIGRHMPNFLRRNTADLDTQNNADVEASAGNESPQSEANGLGPDMDEKLAASVNVTVLIAMPSTKTVFPSTKRPPLRNGRHATNGSNGTALSRVDDKEEWAHADDSSFKGKAKRAASLRSVRSVQTTASTKSKGEARREAFFRAEEEQKPIELPILDSERRSSNDEDRNMDEEEELPEIVFGTASVPLYSRISPSLLPPSRAEILKLVSSASGAKQRKEALNKSSEPKAPKNKEEDVAATPHDQQRNGPNGDLATAQANNGIDNGTQDSTSLRRSSEIYEMDDIPSSASRPVGASASAREPTVGEESARS